jgi:peptidoglycan/LPS O-acetylase OafA/YrhL
VVIIVALGNIQGIGRIPFILLGGLLILPVMQSTGVVSRVLSNRWILYLGTASYAIYMTHDIVLRVLRPGLLSEQVLTMSAPIRLLGLLALYAAVFAVGILTFRLVEVPAERWLRGGRRVDPDRILAEDRSTDDRLKVRDERATG